MRERIVERIVQRDERCTGGEVGVGVVWLGGMGDKDVRRWQFAENKGRVQ